MIRRIRTILGWKLLGSAEAEKAAQIRKNLVRKRRQVEELRGKLATHNASIEAAPARAPFGEAIAENDKDANDFYGDKFTQEPAWATPYPNLGEARRWAHICCFLSQIPDPTAHGVTQRLRILDVGCGRGWLTNLANVYGQCDGVDPSRGAIEQARKYFPELRFYTGTVTRVLEDDNFKPYDVIITSEVIEHFTDKDSFVAEISKCLAPNGHVIITTPRGEKHRRYTHPLFGDTKPNLQPTEDWISEKELRSLFERHQFTPMGHDRAYMPFPRMSILHWLCEVPYDVPSVSRVLSSLGLTWVHKGLLYLAGIYQVWWFQKNPS